MKEMWLILHLQIPAFLTCFFQVFPQTVSIIMCGHLSKEELDGAALACTLINVGGLCIGLGISTACDTFFSQTFGSENKKRVGLYLQRSLIVMYMALILVYCMHLMARPLLPLLGQDLQVSELTANYIVVFMPGVFFDYTFLVLARYLQNQNIVFPPLICALVANIFNAISQYIAIYVLELGYLSSAVCQAASMAVMCITLALYIYFSKVYIPTWDGWTKEAFYDIGSFFKIAIPGLVLVLLEMLAFEIGTLIAGLIDTVELGAQGIVFQCATLTYMLSLGMSIAVNIRVGQNLGANNPEAAKHSAKVSFTMILVYAILLATAYGSLQTEIPKIFTSDAEVIAASQKVFSFYALFPFVDGLSAAASGVLKGCGKQLIGAFGNLLAYDIIALPVGIPLALLTNLKISGLWLALLTGVAIETVIFFIIISRLDWNEEARKTVARTSNQYVSEVPKEIETDHEQAALILSNREHKKHQRLYSSGKFEVTKKVDTSPPDHLPPFRPVLLKRLLTFGILFAFLTAAIIARSTQTPLYVKNVTRID